MKTTLSTKKYKQKPVVSVVIPVFNGAHFLEETVQSIQKSTYRKFEILLIDDGSTDKSKAICKKLMKRYHNVRFYNFPRNRGLGRVLNFALAKARGEFICRINQDDRMHPDRMTIQLQFLAKHSDVVAVGSTIRLFDESGKTTIVRYLTHDTDIKRVWHVLSPFSDPSVMYRKQVAIALGGYKQEYWPADDTHLWIRMGVAGKLANIAKPLVDVRYHNQAASIAYFRKLAIVTHKMHRWMHEFVETAPLAVQAFWIMELTAGFFLSPHINWSAYRRIKKIFYTVNVLLDRVHNIHINVAIKTKKVIPQPIMLSRSGQ